MASQGNPLKPILALHSNSTSTPPSMDLVEQFVQQHTTLAPGDQIARVTTKSGATYLAIRPVPAAKTPGAPRGAKAFVARAYERYIKLGKTPEEARRLVATIAEAEGVDLNALAPVMAGAAA